MLTKFITSIEILDFDFNATIEYSRIRPEIERTGNPIGSLDTLIAAYGLSTGSILVTNNKIEFTRVSDLKVGNWVRQDLSIAL